MNEDGQNDKSLGEKAKDELKDTAKNKAKNAITKKLMAIIAAVLPYILIVVIVCLIVGAILAAAQWLIDKITSDKMGELTTNLTVDYCTIGEKEIIIHKDKAIETINSVLEEYHIDYTDLGLGTDEQVAQEYLCDMLISSVCAELPTIPIVFDDGTNLTSLGTGIIKILRATPDLNTIDYSVDEGIIEPPIRALAYMGYNNFLATLNAEDGGDSSQKAVLMDYYSLDSNWNLCIVRPQIYNETETYTEVKIPYREVIAQYGMPFNFLINLLQSTSNGNYVKAVADLAQKGNIEYTIFDSYTVKTDQYTHTYDEYTKTKNEDDTYSTSGPDDGEDTWTNTELTDQITGNVTYAKTWMLEQTTKYECTQKITVSETTDYPENESEPSGAGSWKTNQKLVINTEIDKFEWAKSGDTQNTILTEEFMGLWKNASGQYSEGVKYDPNGQVVAYYLVGSKTATDRPIMSILIQEDWLIGLLKRNYFTQIQAEYIKYTLQIYKDGYGTFDLDLSIFNPYEFIDGSGGLSIGYGTINFTEKEREFLAKVVYAERGNGTQEQQEYVVSVILNRVLCSKFPNSIDGVLNAVGQFETVTTKAYKNVTPTETTYAAIDEVSQNGDTTGGAVYFCTPAAAASGSWWSTLEFLFNDTNNTNNANSHNFYTTNEIKNELMQYDQYGNGNGGTIIEEAKAAHKYLELNGYKYDQVGLTIPNGLLIGKTVDCSSFVSWVLYRAGYTQFEGHQATSSVFKQNPWGWEEISSINQAQAGDILVYSSHVEIYAGELNNGRPLVYNCGGNWSIQNPAPSTSGNPVGNIRKILRAPEI